MVYRGKEEGSVPKVITLNVMGDLPEDQAVQPELDNAKTKAWSDEAKSYSTILEPAIQLQAKH